MENAPLCYTSLMKLKPKKVNGHPALWATLTILSFPIVATTVGWLGASSFKSFLAGAGASLAILILEAIVRGRWWMAEPAIASLLNDPHFSRRLIFVTFLLVFVFQTLVLTGFLANPSMDRNVIYFILKRQCVMPTGSWLSRICDTATRTEPSMDASLMQVRLAAEQRFFADGFVTCAARSIAVANAPQTSLLGVIVRCDRWTLGTVTRTPLSEATEERVVVSLLNRTPDGTYVVSGWSDDPSMPEWSALGGDLAAATAQRTADAWNVHRQDMRRETYRRAFEQLQAQ